MSRWTGSLQTRWWLTCVGDLAVGWSVMDQLATLREISFFSGLPPDALEAIVAIGERVSFEPGAAIVEQGDPGDAMYVGLSGSARSTWVDGSTSSRRASSSASWRCWRR